MTVELRTYPLPRRNRVGPGSALDLSAASQAAESLVPPRGRVFPFVFNITASTRRTFSTPLLIGPAILKRLSFGGGSPASPPNQTLELGWSPILVTEAGVALTTTRPYTVLTELQNPFSVMAGASGQGFQLTTVMSTSARWEWAVDLIITEARFAFTVSLVNNSVSAAEFDGFLSVMEAVNPLALAQYTGS